MYTLLGFKVFDYSFTTKLIYDKAPRHVQGPRSSSRVWFMGSCPHYFNPKGLITIIKVLYKAISPADLDTVKNCPDELKI